MTDKLSQRIVHLVKKGELKELEGLLLNTEDDWIIQLIDGWVRRPESPKWVGGVVSSLSCNTRESTSLRIKIFKRVLKCVREGLCASEKIAGNLVGALMVRVERFPPTAIVTLIDHYLDLIREGEPLLGSWVDLFPKLISSISKKEDITVDGKEMAGEDYRYEVLKAMCDLDWCAETTTRFLPIISDMDFPKEEIEDVIYKVERVLKDTEDYQSVPPIIYQLITLACTKLPSRLITVIQRFFTRQDHRIAKQKEHMAKNTNDVSCSTVDFDEEIIGNSKQRDLLEAKGTVILHVTHFAQYKVGLVKDYIKFIKASTWLAEKLITPFNLSLSLSLSSIERYEESILSALKACLLRAFQEEEQRNQSRWMRDSWGADFDIDAAFESTVDDCVMGWDQVSQGLVHLSFSLLEYSGGLKGRSYSCQRAAQLATTILPRIVKKQPQLTHTVLKRLCNFILSSSSPHFYIDILGKLAKMIPLSLLQDINVLQGPLDNLDLLSRTSATLLLHAYSPLFRMNMALKDSVMLILRKLLFSRETESRHVAVCGFLQFLRNFRLMGALPSSQGSMSFCSSLSTSVAADVHTVFNNSTNEALCLELLGILRRCFSQQHEVKSTFYGGLNDVCIANPKLAVNIMQMMVQHVKEFLDLRPDILNPVVLKKIIIARGDNMVLMEPIGDALSSLAACKNSYEKRRADNGDEDDDDHDENAVEVLNELCSMFDVLLERLAGCDLDDLGINPNGDFTTGSASGQKNIFACQVMINVFDSLMEYTFINGGQDSDETMQKIVSLFKSQKKVVDLVKEKSTKPGKSGEGSKGKGRPSSKVTVNVKSHLGLHIASSMLAASLGPDSNAGSVLRNNHEFQMYLLTVVEEHVSAVKNLSKSKQEKNLPHLKSITNVLFHECLDKLGVGDSSDEREVSKFRHSLQIVNSLMIIFTKYYKDKMETIIKDILGKTDNKKLDPLLYKFAKRCQKMLLRIVPNEENSCLLKDAVTIVQIMSTATEAMDPNCTELGDIQDWINQLCKDQAQEHSEVAKYLLTFLIKLSNQIKFNHTLTRYVAKDLHHKLGDFDPGVEVEETNKYKIINEHTAAAILSALLSHLDDTLNLVEIVINKMKACVASNVDFDANKVEKFISIKLTSVMSSAHDIIQSAIPDGTTIDQTLRVLTKLYNVLSLYVKYYLDLYKVKRNTQISDKFENVVSASADMISKPVYPMITYIESTQRQVGGGKKHSVQTARAVKEGKLIPLLIYSLEQYEKHLITLTKKSKVNLMHNMTLSTARDFRIMPAALKEILDEEAEEEEEESREENGTNVTNGNDETSDEERENDDRRSPDRNIKKSQEKKKNIGKKRKSGDDEEEKTARKRHKSQEDTENNRNSQNTQSTSKKGKNTSQKKKLSKNTGS